MKQKSKASSPAGFCVKLIPEHRSSLEFRVESLKKRLGYKSEQGFSEQNQEPRTKNQEPRCSIKRSLIAMISLVILVLSCNLSAQLFDEPEEEWDEQYLLRGEQKSAARAIIYSSIFPGAGHLYANPRSIGTYLFPLLEIGFWAGYFYFNNQGDQIEKDYMAFADKNYSRDYFIKARDHLIEQDSANNIYKARDPQGNLIHFRLDDDNTQHFYEDIGKYNKYIFGWTDWWQTYVDADNGQIREIRWVFAEGLDESIGNWLGNIPIDSDPDAPHDTPYSQLRAEYIQMRRDAQENYDISYLMTFGLALNRIVSSVDAVRLTTKYNRELRYSYDFNFGLQPDLARNSFTPTLNIAVTY